MSPQDVQWMRSVLNDVQEVRRQMEAEQDARHSALRLTAKSLGLMSALTQKSFLKPEMIDILSDLCDRSGNDAAVVDCLVRIREFFALADLECWAPVDQIYVLSRLWDDPDLSPGSFPGLYLQMGGRALRPEIGQNQ